MFYRLKTYLPVATFLVLVVSLCYLEFPVVTGLILLIMVVLYLCFNDGIGGRKKSYWPMQASDSLRTAPARNESLRIAPVSYAKFEKNRRRALLGGLSGFCLEVEGRAGWRNPFIVARAQNLMRKTLAKEGLLCGSRQLWLTDSQFACLQSEVLVERAASCASLTVKMTVVGIVEVNRSQGSIRDQTVLWQYTVQRIAAGSLVQAALLEALEIGFDALMRDYLSETRKLRLWKI